MGMPIWCGGGPSSRIKTLRSNTILNEQRGIKYTCLLRYMISEAITTSNLVVMIRWECKRGRKVNEQEFIRDNPVSESEVDPAIQVELLVEDLEQESRMKGTAIPGKVCPMVITCPKGLNRMINENT